MQSKCVPFLLCGLFLAAPALAQVCPDPILITCGDTLSGNNQGGPNQIDSYSCLGGPWGPEAHYLFVLPDCADVTITVTPASSFDATLAIIPRAKSDCDPENCLAGADSGYDGDPETLAGNLAPGQYHLVVDGYGVLDYGSFTLSVSCSPHASCTDGDGDGFYAEGACPCGDDCDDADPAVHPAALESCGDGADQDCDNFDLSCPACTGNQALNCNTAGSLNLNALSDVVSDYCGADQNAWTGKEAVFAIDGADQGITFTTTETQDIDLFVLQQAGPSNCNPTACAGWSVGDATGDEQVSFFAYQGITYYVVVDGWNGVSPNFDWTAACYDDSCEAAGAITCGQTVSGSTIGAANQVTVYNAFGYEMPAGDRFYSFTAQADGILKAELVIGSAADLALAVLADDGSGCHPGHAIGGSDWINANTGPTEEVFFEARAGTTYYLVVDGWTLPDEAAFDLSLTCVTVCTGGSTDCAGACVDLQSDLSHCGDCDTVCTAPNGTPACQAGSCAIAACDQGYENCDGVVTNGCEADLSSDLTCGDCDTTCSGQFFCWQGSCTDVCPDGLQNCSGDCVDLDNDPAHCGGCDAPCNLAHASAICTNGTCSLDACDPGFDTCDGNEQNGCETDITTDDAHCGVCDNPCTGITFCWQSVCTDQCTGGLSNCGGDCVDTDTDPDHCGGCDAPCTYDNASGACTAGSCSFGACLSGFGNCDGQILNGCEEILGSLSHCLACGDACSYANAVATCEVAGCTMGACALGYDDCDEDPSNGCEADLNSAATCGDCLTACDPDHADGSCEAGVCSLGDCYNGWANCDGDPLTGCEADLASRETCGSCDNSCSGVEICDGGVCKMDCSDLDGDGHYAANCGGDDCNDFDANAHPGATEICGDGVDQDCSGADLGCGNCHDNDADGYEDHICGGPDCDDADADAHPGGTEVCGDGIDQDCDGQDETCGGCHDNDSDGYDDHVCGGPDCDDTSSFIYPGATEICGDGIDQDCSGQDLTCSGCADADGDGYQDAACGGNDCNDQSAAIHPGAIESCGDDVDQNCDGIDRPCAGGGSGCGCGTAPAAGGFWGLFILLALWEYGRRRNR